MSTENRRRPDQGDGGNDTTEPTLTSLAPRDDIAVRCALTGYVGSVEVTYDGQVFLVPASADGAPCSAVVACQWARCTRPAVYADRYDDSQREWSFHCAAHADAEECEGCFGIATHTAPHDCAGDDLSRCDAEHPCGESLDLCDDCDDQHGGES